MSVRRRLVSSIAIALISIFLLHCAPGSVVLVDCGLSLDDTQQILTALDNVAEGGWVIFPETTGGSGSIETDILNECRISEAIRITRPVHLVGGIQGRTEIQRMDDFSLSGTHLAGTIFHVTSSGVSIFGMALTGAEYGNVQRRNTHGIWVQSVAPAPRIENFTAQNLEISRVRGRGISLERVDDFVIKGNTVTHVGYAGIFLSDVNRGWVDDNEVRSINDPEVCSESCPALCLAEGQQCDQCTPSSAMPVKACQYINSYGIVVTGCSDGVPCSSNIRISQNRVCENERWVGIMNHGGQYILVIDNSVEDTNFLYANTVSESNPKQSSHDTAFINNFGDILPPFAGGVYPLPDVATPTLPATAHGEGLWMAGWDSPITQRVDAIGNTFLNTGLGGSFGTISVTRSLQDSRITWNRFEALSEDDPAAAYSVVLTGDSDFGIKDHLIIAHNHMDVVQMALDNRRPGASEILLAYNDVGLLAFDIAKSSDPGTFDIHDNTLNLMPEDPNGVSGYVISDEISPPSNFLPLVTVFENQPNVAPALYEKPNNKNGGLNLGWTYPTTASVAHDSFTLEAKDLPLGDWEVVAYRPANDPKWVFDAPSHPNWTPFDPLQYRVDGLIPTNQYSLRIRANNGSKYSAWSNELIASP